MKKVRNISMFLMISLMALTTTSFAKDTEQLAEPSFEPDIIYLQIQGEYADFSISVAGPDMDYTLKFSGDETPYLDILDVNGNPLPDGLYTYQIVAAPLVDEVTRAEMRAARAEMRNFDGPRGKVQSGTFRIVDGTLINPNAGEPLFTVSKTDETEDNPPTVATDADPDRAQVFVTDVVVQGSECVGFDCVNGESFGFDTIRLKENNLRIHFQDTSNSASFPTADWRIVANDTGNGGSNYLAFEDTDSGTYPFRVVQGAGNNALYVDAQGDVGLNTNAPVVELHIASGDSPTMRLEQTGASGFTPQTWDVAGNETNFFVRDATNGSALAFRIRPGSQTDNALYIDTDGDIGLGDTSPDAALDIEQGTVLIDNDAAEVTDSSLTVHNTGNTYANTTLINTSDTTGTRSILQVKNKGLGKVQLTNTLNAYTWSFGTENNKDFTLYSDNGANASDITFSESGAFVIHNMSDTAIMDMDSSGNVNFAGTVSKASDRNMKENFTQEDPLEILARVAALPITSWNYKADNDGVRHMGPMAQDFYAAFGLGHSDRFIADGDTGAVALLSVQALNASLEQEVAAKNAEISELRQQLADQEARLKRIEAALLK